MAGRRVGTKKASGRPRKKSASFPKTGRFTALRGSLELGDEIAKALGQEADHDLLAHWMARHLAQKIAEAKKAGGSRKDELDKECSELILKLWDRRHSLPNGARPLVSFEPLFDALKQLSADSFRYAALGDIPETAKGSEEVRRLCQAAVAIDAISGALIRYALSEAVKAVPSKDKRWLKLRKAIAPPAWDIQIIRFLADEKETPVEKERKAREALVKGFEKTLGQLEVYSAFADAMKGYLQKRLLEAKEA